LRAVPSGLLLVLLGCGGGTPEPVPAEAPRDEPAPVEVAPEPEAEPVADTEAEPAADTEAEREPERVQRSVLYKVTGEGLVVDVDGVRLRPKAEAVKKEKGSYGIRITVEAESTDDDTHVLLSPEHGPMSFAARIYDKSGAEVSRSGDERAGDDQQFIMPGGPLTFTREWPSGSVKGPLWWGQKVSLHVGLWGLARANEKTRPMQKFFVVEMVAGAKPQAVISPPVIDRK
jgi:hypothetical protein